MTNFVPTSTHTTRPTPAGHCVVPRFIRGAPCNVGARSTCSHLFRSHVVFLNIRISSTSTSSIVTRLLILRSRSPGHSIVVCVGSPNNSVATVATVCSAVRCVGPSIRAIYLNRTTSTTTVLLTSNAGNGHLVLPGTHILVRRPTVSRNFNGTARVRVRTGRVLHVHR